MQEDSNNKATSLYQKLQAGFIVFSLFGPTNIRWYVWCWQNRRFRRGFKTLTNMCQEDINVLNIKGCHPKSFIMHCFPIIPTCGRPFLTNKNESLDNDLTCQLSEIIKANNLVKKFISSDMKPNAKDIQLLVFHINTYYDNRKKIAGILLRIMHTRG